MQVYNSLDKTVVVLTEEDIENLKEGLNFSIDILLVPVSVKWNAFLSNLILTTCGQKGEIIYYLDKK